MRDKIQTNRDKKQTNRDKKQTMIKADCLVN